MPNRHARPLPARAAAQALNKPTGAGHSRATRDSHKDVASAESLAGEVDKFAHALCTSTRSASTT